MFILTATTIVQPALFNSVELNIVSVACVLLAPSVSQITVTIMCNTVVLIRKLCLVVPLQYSSDIYLQKNKGITVRHVLA